jgi:hypothetical protein
MKFNFAFGTLFNREKTLKYIWVEFPPTALHYILISHSCFAVSIFPYEQRNFSIKESLEGFGWRR